jgi:hypothetical protein
LFNTLFALEDHSHYSKFIDSVNTKKRHRKETFGLESDGTVKRILSATQDLDESGRSTPPNAIPSNGATSKMKKRVIDGVEYDSDGCESFSGPVRFFFE